MLHTGEDKMGCRQGSSADGNTGNQNDRHKRNRGVIKGKITTKTCEGQGNASSPLSSKKVWCRFISFPSVCAPVGLTICLPRMISLPHH
ncbi:hypothetical protein E2C01_026638 [Portunus trituberculatus]|uniref:Uncharacterized protein n=1 Tax=Portunus trituberculatus TaxID=210409 RepID=A0A5B7ELI7_PORTR|nr:hypothetical protein [Portunus trituberculatus]